MNANPLTGEIPTWECERLLADHAIGRICVTNEGYPLAFPVTYHLVGGPSRRLILRTRVGNVIARGTGPASFQLDHVDEHGGSAWSVIARGQLLELHDPVDGPELRRWVLDGRGHYLELRIEGLSGRRFVSRTGDDDAVVEWQLAG